MLRSALECARRWLQRDSSADSLVLRPRSVSEIQQIVRQCSINSASVSVSGGSVCRSSSRKSDAANVVVDLSCLNRVLGLDVQRQCVVVEAGIRLSKLLQMLEPIGLALDLGPGRTVDLAVVDLIATGCSGNECHFLWSVESLETVSSDGSVNVWTWERNSSEMRAALGGLGALAVVCSLTIRCVPLTRYSEVSYLCSVRDVLSQWQLHCRSSWGLQLWWFPFSELSVLTHTNAIDDSAPVLASNHRYGPGGVVHRVVELFTLSFSTATRKFVDFLIGLCPWHDTSWSSSMLSLLIALLSRVHFFTLWSLARQRSDRTHSLPPLWNATDFQRGHRWLVPEHHLPEVIHCISKFVRYNQHSVTAKPVFVQRVSNRVQEAIEVAEEGNEDSYRLVKWGAKKALMRSRRRKLTERSERRHRKRPYLMPAVEDATAAVALSTQQSESEDVNDSNKALWSMADDVRGESQGLCTVWYDWFLAEHEPDAVLVASFESIFHSVGARRVWSTDRLTSPLVLRDSLGEEMYAKWCRLKLRWDPENVFRSAYIQGTIYSEEMASQIGSTAASVISGSTLSLCSASFIEDE